MDKYIPCRWMTSFVYLRNLATSDIPISGFPVCFQKGLDVHEKKTWKKTGRRTNGFTREKC